MQYALIKLRLDRRRVGIERQRDRSTERAVAELHHVPALILVLLVALGLFLTADGEHPIGERYVQILLIDARQLCGDFDRILALGNVDLRDSMSELNRANGVRCEKSSNVF
jgi:hypothetical protein